MGSAGGGCGSWRNFWWRGGRKTQRKARRLTQRTQRKAENTEKTVGTAAVLFSHEIQNYF
jgi:hypothetical protein